MALHQCSECGRQVSTTAKGCPNCGAPPPKIKRSTAGGWLVFIGLLVLGIVALVDSSEKRAEGERRNSGTAPIAQGALQLIEGSGWEKVRRSWGEEGIQRINELMPLAAERVAQSVDCGGVEVVGLSDRSTPKKEIVLFIDCKDRQRFYVTEVEVLANAPLRSANSQTNAISSVAATKACEESAISQLQEPLSFKRVTGTTVVNKDMYGRMSVDFDFEAQNGLGARLRRHARCVLDDRGIYPATTSER